MKEKRKDCKKKHETVIIKKMEEKKQNNIMEIKKGCKNKPETNEQFQKRCDIFEFHKTAKELCRCINVTYFNKDSV